MLQRLQVIFWGCVAVCHCRYFARPGYSLDQNFLPFGVEFR